jgi:kynureninase
VGGRRPLAGEAVIPRERAEHLDESDPLAAFRDRFVIDDPETIYLDGNSLGRLPVATRELLGELVDQWGSQLVRGWHDWIDLPERVGDELARVALGARAGEVIVADSTTVNLFKLASAALDVADDARAIVTDAHNFPTDRYVLDGLARQRGVELRLFEPDPIEGPQLEDVVRACEGGDVGLVCLSHVGYRSGALADVETITREAGVRVIWDLSHSVGVVPIELGEWAVELAVGCTYKYLNGGPGAPAFLYVREELQESLATPIQGWFGQREQFAMERPYDPEPGIRRFMAGTPPILDLTAVRVGVELVGDAGIASLRRKAVALTDLIVELHDDWLAPLGFELASPRDAVWRGAHVSLRHDEAWPISRALIERARVIPDFRGPDSIRLGVPPLYTRAVDVWDALDRLRALVERGVQREVDASAQRVT